MRGTLEQRIKVRIIRGLGIRAEDGGIHINVHRGAHVGQTPPALTLHLTVHATAPQVFAVTCRLQLPCYRYGTNQMEVQPFERRIVGPKLPYGPDRASLEVPDVYSQHSRLK
jgi:hypothetical protein